VLFDANNKGVCVIDLDTVMPGYFLSDVGDMIRTYITTVSEEESDFSKIVIQQDFLQAIKKGYYHYMEVELTEFEKQHFLFAGEMMIYMQAIRFLTDYFNDDKYYKINYPEQNLVRAKNQMYLLKALKALPDLA
jgi:argonaute-like protein implicated in RNA metabolism and viral defense